MKKQIFLFAVAALALASCSSENDVVQTPAVEQTADDGAVMFDAYAQRPTTRAGQTGVMKLDKLKNSVDVGGGFGVFAYYTDNNYYSPTRIPDFMYNQLVKFDNGSWTYAPVKYWPNEYGDNAISDDNDRVSFFAYAPYVTTTNSGKVEKGDNADDTWGIVGMSRNSAVGDPLVKYIASFEEDKSVDLLWGVCDDVNWQLVNTGSVQQTINGGEPGFAWKDVQRPQGLAQKMKFTFKHALTQLSVYVDAAVDDFSSNNYDLAAGTKIYVRSVSFTGVTMKGTLNLNNVEANKALWLDYNGIAELTNADPITIYDGLKDGKEGIVGNKAVNEKIVGLNPAIISNEGNTTKGVVASTNANGGKPQELFANTPAMLIPTGEDLEVEIVYDVETEDPSLATLLSDGKKTGSSIENRIKKTVSFGEKGLESGKHYTLNLHLGMNSVKFDAAVSDWQESYEVHDADLPANMPAFTAQTEENVTINTVTISGTKQDYIFAVTGLKPGESVTASIVGNAKDALGNMVTTPYVNSSPSPLLDDIPVTDGKANASGIAYVGLKNVENKTVRNLDAENTLQIQGGESKQTVKLKFTQKASPYLLKIASVGNGTDDDEIILTTLNSSLTSVNEIWDAGSEYNNGWDGTVVTTENAITVKKNGKKLAYDTSIEEGKFTWTAADKKITVKGHLVPGDIIEITFDNKEAPAETVIAKIGGITFVPSAGSLTYRTADYVNAITPVWVGGEGMQGLSWTPSDNSNTFVNVTNGTIKTKKVTSPTTQAIKATVTNTHVDNSDWFYTATSKEATYTLTINKQNTEIRFENPNPAAININKDNITDPIYVNLAKVYGEEDGDLSEIITYSIKSAVKKSNGDIVTSKFTMMSSDDDKHKLKLASSLDAHTEYEITVKATYAATTNYNESAKEYTIKVTTGD